MVSLALPLFLGELKQQLLEHTDMDGRVKKAIISMVDVAHGGKAGVFEAISLAAPALNNAR